MKEKRRYRFEVQENGCENSKREVFQEWKDADALARFYRWLHNLPRGSTIVLSCWDGRRRKWIVLKRGGKDPAKQSACDLSGR